MSIAAMSESLMDAWHGGDLKLHRNCGFGEVSNIPPAAKTVTDQGLRHVSSLLSLSYLTISAPPKLAARPPRQGGARNSATRQSHALTPYQASGLIDAARHAAVIGLPLNRMVTIHWKGAGVPLDGMARATGRFTDLLAKCLARHGHRTAWIWTHENGDWKGWHCHMLAHVPASCVKRLGKLQKGWLRRITGKPYQGGVIFSRPVGGRLGIEDGNPALHAANLAVALDYILKGGDEMAAATSGLKRIEPGGRIIGKRCGASQNIGAKARKAELKP